MSVRQLARAVADAHPGLRGTSYGGVRQYADGQITNPRVDVLRALASTLGVRGDWLAFGEGPMTAIAESVERARGLTVSVTGEAAHRTQALVHLIINGVTDLPMSARQMVFGFVNDFYGDAIDGWEDWLLNPRLKAEVRDIVDEHYGPLLDAPRTGELEATALAATLTAAAYLRLSATTKGRAS
jgi:hypothetical protein